MTAPLSAADDRHVTGQRAEPSRINFTKAALTRATRGDKPQRWLYDTGQRGLACCIGADKKTFYFVRKIDGVPERVRLGVFGDRGTDMTVEAARGAAVEQADKHNNGGNTNAEKQAQRAERTLQALFDYFIDQPTGNKVKREKKPRTVAEYRKQFTRYLATDWPAEGNYPRLPSWSDRKINAIHYADMTDRHDAIGKRFGPYVANRTLALLKAMYNSDEGYEGGNPAEGVRLFPEVQRTRFIRADEFPKFTKALNKLPDRTMRDFFWFALRTGQRRSNVQAARWEHIDLSRGEWVIPAEQTKSREPITVQLVPEAVAILKRRHKARGESPWVFPAPGAAGHVMHPKTAWAEVCKAAGMEGVRIHDLRHTFGSWLGNANVHESKIQKAMGHLSPQSTRRYVHADPAAVREAVALMSKAMSIASKGGKK
jgi:integrase